MEGKFRSRSVRSSIIVQVFVVLILLGSCGEDDSPQLNNKPIVASALADLTLDEGFGSRDIDLTNTFRDMDGDQLTYSATSSNQGVVTVAIAGSILTIMEAGIGSSTVEVTADDGNGGMASDSFAVTVNEVADDKVVLSFGAATGNELTINSWTTASNVDGYVIIINDENTFSDLTDGDNPAGSTTYWGTGEQVIYNGASVSALAITLLEQSRMYYFKVFPYSGNFIFDNDQLSAESSTSSCSTTSTSDTQVCFEISSDTRTISSNQWPDHQTGSFPNADVTAIETSHNFDLTPEEAANITLIYSVTGPPSPMNDEWYNLGMAVNGIAIDPMGGIPFENPNTGEENWDWQLRVAVAGDVGLDNFGGHVTSDGKYHYHGDIVALADEDGSEHSVLWAFAGDGFPMYYKYGYTDALDAGSAIKELKSSHRLRSGSRSGDGLSAPDGTYDGTYFQDYEFVEGLGDLDECNGRFGATPEFPDGIYYYVITSEFPFVPNCFRGTPDDSWKVGQ